MVLFAEPIEQYLAHLKAPAKKIFPRSKLITGYIRFNRFKGRLIISQDVFIDLYFNAENGRKDYTLIKDNKRVLGWDNLGGWHRHPFGKEDKHVKCKEPSVKAVFKKVKTVLKDINGLHNT